MSSPREYDVPVTKNESKAQCVMYDEGGEGTHLIFDCQVWGIDTKFAKTLKWKNEKFPLIFQRFSKAFFARVQQFIFRAH